MQPAEAETVAGISETESPADSAPSADAARFTVVAPFAKGGLGQVSVARDEELGREVALKEIRPDRRDVSGARERFLTEAVLTGQLEHPGIVPIYALEEEVDGSPRYAMRFVRGETLSDAIQAYHAKPSSLAFRDLLGRFVAVCQAVAYAHSKQVIHRDLKPQNIMLGEFGETVVLDWGLAKRIGSAPAESATHVNVTNSDSTVSPRGDTVINRPAETAALGEPTTDQTVQWKDAVDTSRARSTNAENLSSDLTHAGEILGTPAYMAPEQARGETEQIGPAADVYALGAILSEMLTGQHPYADQSAQSVLDLVRNKPPTRPAQVKRGVHRALEAICLKAMAREQSGRYGSASELAEEVERYLADEPVQAYAEPWPARVARWGRRHRVLVSSTAILAMTVIVALSIGLYLIDRERALTDQARGKEQEAKQAALSKLALAELQYQRARDAVEEMLTEVAARDLQDAPYMQTVRKRLLEKALAFYQKFLDEQGDDPVLKQETARAYGRVAFLQSRLGEDEKALRHYQRGLALFTELTRSDEKDASVEYGLAKLQLDMGNSLLRMDRLREAESVFQSALSALKQGKPTGKLAERYKRLEAACSSQWGMTKAELSQQHEALELFDRAEKLYRDLLKANAGEERTLVSLANNFHHQAHVFFEQGDLRGAEQRYRASASLLAKVQLASGAPSSVLYHNYTNSIHRLGGVLAAQGRYSEAEPRYLLAIKRYKQMTDAYPVIPSYRVMLAAAHHEFGDLLQDTRRSAEAEKHARTSLTMLDDLVARYPQRSHYRRDRAGSAMLLGGSLVSLGRHREAVEYLHKSRKELRELKSQFASEPTFHIRFAGSHHNLGMAQLRQGQYDEAEASFKESIRMLKAIHSDKRKIPQLDRDLAGSFLRLGNLYADLGKTKLALETLREANKRYTALNKEFPGVPNYVVALAATHHHLGETWSDLQNLTQAHAELSVSEKMLVPLVKKHANIRPYRRDLANTLARLGTVEVGMSRYQAAEQHLKAAAAEFAKLEKADSDLLDHRVSAAAVYHNFGMLYSLTGRLDLAEKNFNESIQRLEPLLPTIAKLPKPHRDYANSLLRLGDILAEKQQSAKALKALHGARDAFREFVKKFESTPFDRQQQAAVFHQLGTLHLELQEPKKAIPEFDRSIAILEALLKDSPDDVLMQRDLANSLMWQANTYRSAGELDKAEPRMIRALKAFGKLSANFAGQTEHLIRVAGAHHNLAALRLTSDRYKEAEPGFRESIKILTPLARKNPRVPKIRVDLAGSMMRLAKLLADTDRVDDGIKQFEQVLTIYRGLVKEYPRSPIYQIQLAAAHHNLANIHLDNDKFEDAEKGYQASIAQLKVIQMRFGSPPQVLMDMAGSQHALGAAYNASGKLEEAEAILRQSVRSWQFLAARLKNIPRIQASLGNAINEQGVTLLKQNELDKARTRFEEARAIQVKVMKQAHDYAFARRCFVEESQYLAEVFARQQQHEKAAALAKEVAEQLKGKSDAPFGAAMVLGRCLRLWEKDKNLTPAQKEKLKTTYLPQAKAYLQTAIKQDLPDPKRVEKEPDLAPLRAKGASK